MQGRFLFVGLVVMVVVSATGWAEAAPTFLRTNTSISEGLLAFVPYETLGDVASDSPSGATIDINPDLSIEGTYLFFDGTTYYRTAPNGSSTGIGMIYTYDSLDDLATSSSGTAYTMYSSPGTQANWSFNDDFFADSEGNFYRNNSDSNSNAVTQYGSFNDLINNTNGNTQSYSPSFNFEDAFFAYDGVFYRTNTHEVDDVVLGWAVYNSFQDLIDGNVAETINADGTSYRIDDQFIAIPEPASVVLMLVGSLIVMRRHRD